MEGTLLNKKISRTLHCHWLSWRKTPQYKCGLWGKPALLCSCRDLFPSHFEHWLLLNEWCAMTQGRAVTPSSHTMAPHMFLCLPWLLDATPDASGPEMAPGAQRSVGSSSAWPFSFCHPPTPALGSWKAAEKSLCWLAGGGYCVTLGRRWVEGITLDCLEEKVKGRATICRI